LATWRLGVFALRSFCIIAAKNLFTADHANHAKGLGFSRISGISRSPRFSIVFRELRPKMVVRKTLAISNLQITRPDKGRFCPKKRGVLQKNGGPTEIISHFFSRFFGFWGFPPSQAVAFQPQAAIRPLQKKSCLKTYRRFSVRSGMCHNRRVNVENDNWKTGQLSEKWGQKNGPLLSFCPHLFAFKVEEASRLLPVQEQRRAAAATSPVLCAVNFEP
jgi:hypothetical protein